MPLFPSDTTQPDEIHLRGPSGQSIDAPLPTVGETLQAAGMSSSMMVALAQRLMREDFPPEVDYSPAKFVSANPQYEAYRDRFLDSRSHMETLSIAGRIDRENAWNETKRNAGTAGTVADLVMGNADPTIFLPVAGAIRSARGGISVLRTAGAVGVSGAAGVAIQEGALQAQQETRELSESAINVATATLLTSFLGGGFATFLNKGERALLVAKMDRERAQMAAHAAGDPDSAKLLDTPGPTEASEIAGFKTAKGSTYEYHANGTTTRNKAERSDPGHEGDFGPQQRSERTVFLSKEDANRLAPPQGHYAVVDHGDGTVSLATPTQNGWGISPSQRNIPVSDTPTVGAVPLEVWGRENINGLPAYGRTHFGNEIVEVTPRAIPDPEIAPTGSAVPAEGIPATRMAGPQAADAGAAVTDTRQIRPVQALGAGINRAADRIVAAEVPILSSAVSKAMNLTSRFGPLQRSFNSLSVATRRIAADLAEYSGRLEQNLAKPMLDAEGKPVFDPVTGEQKFMPGETTTSTGGPTVERSVRLALNQTRYALAQTMDRLYSDMRYTQKGQEVPGLIGRSVDTLRDFAGRSEEGTMTAKEFSQQVSVALSNKDMHDIPQVAEAARWIRSNIFDPWRDRAIKAGILPKEAADGVVGADSYFHRVFNKEAIRSKPEKFIQIAMDHLRGDQAEKFALQEQARWLNAQRNSFEDNIARLESRLARTQETAKDLEARFDEARKAIERGDKRQNVLVDRAGEAAAEISEIEEFVAAMESSIKDPALQGRLQLLKEEAARLKAAERASEMTPAALKRQEEQELSGLLTGQERLVAQIVTGARKPPEVPSFLSYLVKEGGIKDPRGDVRSIIGARERPGLIDNKNGRSLDEWGEKLTQDFPGMFDGRPSPREVEEFLSEAARGRQPSWWMDALPQEKKAALDASQAALAMQEVLHRAGVEPKNVREVAKLMRDGRTEGGVTLNDLDRIASEMEKVGQAVPPSFERAATQENLGVVQEGIKATREIIRKAQSAADTRARRLENLEAQKGEVGVAETATRGRLGILLDRLVRADTKRQLIEDALVIGQRHVDEIRGKLEDTVSKWHGDSSKDGKAALKAREKYIKENRTDAAGGQIEGKRLTMADDAIDLSIKKMIAANKQLDDQDLRSIAEQMKTRILGSPDGRLPYDAHEGGPVQGVPGSQNPEARGALNQRQMAIPDNPLHEAGFLLQDAEEVAAIYSRTMMPDTIIAERFGDVAMTDAFRKIDEDFNALMRQAEAEGKSEKHMRALEKGRVEANRDLAAMRDRIRMVYGWSDNSIIQNAARAANTIGQWNVVTSMGMSAASSLPDIAGIIMRHGAETVFGDAWRPYFESLRAPADNITKQALQQYAAMGIAVEVVTGIRAHSLDDISDVYRPQSRLERTMSFASDKFMIINGQAYWTDQVKSIAAIVSGNEILQATKALVEGRATKRQLANLGESNITPALAQKIHDQFFTKGFGAIKDRVHLPNTADWTDVAARNAFEGAVAREADIAVVTPGQEKSLWMSTPVLSSLGQFKTFIGSSTERVMIANLQRRDAFTLQGTMASLALGMLSYKIHSLTSGQATSDKPQDWFKEGVSRGGLLGWFEEGNAITSKATGGALDVYRAIGADKPLSRYASRSAVESFLGPTFGKAQNIAKVTSAAGRALTGGDSWTGGDTRAFRQLMATQNLIFMRNGYNAMERGINDAFGIENLPTNK
jgi:hypothetical protein